MTTSHAHLASRFAAPAFALALMFGCGSENDDSTAASSNAVAGAVRNLANDGLTLALADGSSLKVAAGSTTFSFATPAAIGAPYAVTITAQPAGQACRIESGTGTVSNAPWTVVVDCEDRASCAALHADIPAVPSGSYRLDADGAGSLPPFSTACDMDTDGGGWTLILATAYGDGPDQSKPSDRVSESDSGFLPLPLVQAMAAKAGQVNIRTPGHASDASITSKAGNEVIANLRLGHLLNTGLETLSASDQVARWTGPYADADHLAFVCLVSDEAWPSVYWACGNEVGFHLHGGVSTWSYTSGGRASVNTPLAVYIR